MVWLKTDALKPGRDVLGGQLDAWRPVAASAEGVGGQVGDVSLDVVSGARGCLPGFLFNGEIGFERSGPSGGWLDAARASCGRRAAPELLTCVGHDEC